MQNRLCSKECTVPSDFLHLVRSAIFINPETNLLLIILMVQGSVLKILVVRLGELQKCFICLVLHVDLESGVDVIYIVDFL